MVQIENLIDTYIFRFGKHKGRKIIDFKSEKDYDYLNYILKNWSDLREYDKKVINKYIENREFTENHD